MKNFKKREYNSLDGSFLKNHDFSKKHKANALACENRGENQLPINWHEVKIILDATVVEKYLNNRKSAKTISPSHREKMLVQKIPRLNQNVFSENSNVMVKLEIPEDIRVDDNLSLKESLVFDDVPVKQEDCISVLDSLDNETFHNREFIEPLHVDFQCQDNNNFTVEVALKNEVVESQNCYKEVTIGQEFKDTLKNEELFVGEEFKHEESISSYENVESIDQENNEEIIKKNTRSSRKRKKCLDCDDCSHGLEKKSRVPVQVVTHKLSVQDPKTCKFQTPSESSTSKSFLSAKEKKSNQESSTKPQPQKGEYRVYHCAHCDHKGRREVLIKHYRNKHPYTQSTHIQISKVSICCSYCGEEFPSRVDMRRHRSVCLPLLICKFCLVEVTSKRIMVKHMMTVHPEIYVEEGESLDEVCTMKMLDLTPFGQSYMEIRKFYFEIKSELIKFYCPKCAVTRDKIISRIAPRCDSCESQLLYQCQKCKGIRYYYSHILTHLKSKHSYCSIYGNLSFMDHVESSDVVNKASSNEPKCHDCEICDFKGTTRTKLHDHVLSVHLDDGITRNGWYTKSKCDASFRVGNGRLKRSKDLYRIAARLPCRFCPTNYSNTKNLSDHMAIMHLDELDGKDVDEFLKEALDFTRMVTKVNLERFNNKLRNDTAKTERNYYHEGIESVLKPVCIECKSDGPHEPEYCAKCQASLNFVCLKCDELFSKYSVAWDHATRMCENGSFTSTVGKTCRAKLDASTKDKELLYCNYCSFKNASKSILYNHIKYTHSKSQEVQILFTCPKCYRSCDNAGLLRQHRLRCRVGFHYTCHFCNQSSINFHVIEDHITTTHADHVRCKDTLDQILQQVFDNKRASTIKTNYRFNEFGRRIRRTFFDNVKLTTFYCTNCDETVNKIFRYVTDTSRCPKCNCKLRLYCKVCNKRYFYWQAIASHFQNTECGAAKIESYDLDHSYSLRQRPPEVTKNSVEV